jgi:hypothetical protein
MRRRQQQQDAEVIEQQRRHEDERPDRQGGGATQMRLEIVEFRARSAGSASAPRPGCSEITEKNMPRGALQFRPSTR